MHERLVSYLRDNRDQIIESWLLETELPPADDLSRDSPSAGTVPLGFLTHAFESIVTWLSTGDLPPEGSGSDADKSAVHLDDFLGLTTACKQRCFGGRVCIELHDAGLKAFLSVFEADWDTGHEFSAREREFSAEQINRALSRLFAEEIAGCRYKQFRADCPFIATAAITHAPHLL